MTNLDRKAQSLFQAPANKSRIQSFNCAGFAHPVAGTVYPRASFRWHGVPLGGLGTGYVCWDGDGRLSQCTIYNQLPTACSVPVVNVIPFRVAVNGRSWALAMRADDGQGDLADLRYFGHFPIVDAQFDVDAPLDVEIRAFGPFLPGDAVESNTPAVVFEVRLANTGDQPLETEVSFTPPPPPTPAVGSSQFNEGSWHGAVIQHPMFRAGPMMGQRPATHEIAVAVEEGQAVAGESNVGASFRASLAPGATARTRFVLAWHQPYIRDAGNRAERLMYATRFSDAAAVARHAIARHQVWLERIIRWQSAIYAREELPPALREALVNSFYSICKNAHWIARWRPDDWFPANGLFLVNESFTTCSISETLVCHSTHFPVLFFFPELERTTLEAYRHYQLGTGELPFSLSPGFGTRAPTYQCQHPNGTSQYIEYIFRHWLRTGDDDFLRDFYPSVKAALGYLEFLDTDGDGLVNEHSYALPGENWPANVGWDQWPQQGTSCFTAMVSLTACLALARMAEHVGDDETASHCLARVDRGRQRMEELLWNGSYYRLCADPAAGVADETCLSAQLTGAWSAAVLGLEAPVPEPRIRSALEAVLRLTDGLSDYGLVLAATPDGSLVYSNLSLNCDFPRDVWPIFNFVVTAVCLYHKTAQDRGWAATERVLDALFRAANAMPWGWPCNLNSFDGWIGHGHDYQDPLSLWTIPMALSGQDMKAAVEPGSLVQDILHAAGH